MNIVVLLVSRIYASRVRRRLAGENLAMKMRRAVFRSLALCTGFGATHAAAVTLLKSAANFAVLGGAAVANAGVTALNGDVGIAGAAALPTSFTLNGEAHGGDAVSVQAISDATDAFTSLSALSAPNNLTGIDLGSLTLTPGVYTFSAAAQLTGPLVLNFEHLAHQTFVFQVGSALTTADNATVDVENGGPDSAIYWVIGSSATLGSDSQFAGNIIAAASVTLGSGASIISGRAIALGGAVTLNTNTISINSMGLGDFGTGRRDFNSQGFSGGGLTSSPAPEPQTWTMVIIGLAFIGGVARVSGRNQLVL